MSSPVGFGALRRGLLRRAALRYAEHGWPVVPGAFPSAGGFRCDRAGCPARGCHPAFEEWPQAASTDPATVVRWWSGRSHSVLFPTGVVFDVIEAPADIGEVVARRRSRAYRSGNRDRPRLRGPAARCPVAVTPTGRWMFFVRPGEDLRRGLAERLTVLRHGVGSWVPAPPTRFPEGRVFWQVPPEAVGWLLGDPRKVQRALVRAGEPERAGPEYLLSPRVRSPGSAGSPGSCRTTARH
jgi:hypothetical protein